MLALRYGCSRFFPTARSAGERWESRPIYFRRASRALSTVSSESGVQGQTFRPQPMGLWFQSTSPTPWGCSFQQSGPGNTCTALRLRPPGLPLRAVLSWARVKQAFMKIRVEAPRRAQTLMSPDLFDPLVFGNSHRLCGRSAVRPQSQIRATPAAATWVKRRVDKRFVHTEISFAGY